MNYRALAVLVMCVSLSNFCCAAQQNEQNGCDELVSDIREQLTRLLPQAIKNTRGSLSVCLVDGDDGGWSVIDCGSASLDQRQALARTLPQIELWRSQLVACRKQNPERKASIYRPFGLRKSKLQLLVDSLDTQEKEIRVCCRLDS